MKKLYRSHDDRMLGGVCGGLGEHFGVDPTLLRLLAVFLVVFTAFVPGVIVYLVWWLIVPEEPAKPSKS